MWAAVMGTAFASKASTAAVGLTILLAGAGTAEVAGIGPAVRESLGITQTASNDDGEQAVEVRSNGLGAENSSEQSATVARVEDAPGNLVTNVRPDGGFSLRGQLTENGILTASGEIAFDLSAAELQIPGQANPNAETSTLDDYVGSLVHVTGSCEVPEGEALDMALHCSVESVTVLGQAGQGKPEDTGKPELLPGNGPDGAGKPDASGASSIPDQTPDEPGSSENKPPGNPPRGNPNSD